MTDKNDTGLAEPGDDMELLLPWYASGQLAAEERAKVDAYLAEQPQARRHLELIREEMDQAIGANEAIGAPSARMMDRLLADIEAAEGPERQGSGRGSLLQMLTGWMPAASGPGLRVAALAAALIIVVQAAALGVMIAGGAGVTGGYQVASGGGEVAAQGPQFLVAFSQDAPAARIVAALDQAGVSVIAGPRAGGLFLVALKDAKADGAARDKAMEVLRAEPGLVTFIAPSG